MADQNSRDHSTIQLANAAEVTVGCARIKPPTREVVWSGGTIMVEPRVMQIVLALIKRPGEVVSRDELLECCWAGVIVSDDAINRAIAKSRQLGQTTGSFTIEIHTKT